MYTYPEHISNQLIEIIRREEKICNYLDLPIQHSASRIRDRMNRDGSREKIVNLINNLRNQIPDIALRTSLIVGFPGETTADFKNLTDFVRKIKFDRLGAFQYSKEEGTAAAELPDQVPEDIKEKRYNQLMKIQQKIARESNQKLIDEKFEVIIDECYNKYSLARSQYDAPEIDNQIYIYDENLETGDIINCKINEAYEYDLVGEKL
jgi:ribosomal protein S12 methylthiotransferase